MDDREKACVEGELGGRYCGLRKEMGWGLGHGTLGNYRNLI